MRLRVGEMSVHNAGARAVAQRFGKFIRETSRALLLLGLLANNGCGGGINPGLADRGEFEVYFQRFLTYAAEHKVSTRGDDGLRIEFSDLKSTEVGRCETGFLSGRIVYIDRTRWEVMVDGSREALILHELGHCLLGRGHVSTKFPEEDETMPGLPRSLMYPLAMSGTRFNTHKKYYVDELFSEVDL